MCEYPTVYWEKERKARKEHKCCDCGSVIKIGELYTYVCGIWNGEGKQFKFCSPCWKLRQYYSDTDDCIPYGYLHEELANRCCDGDYPPEDLLSAEFRKIKQQYEEESDPIMYTVETK